MWEMEYGCQTGKGEGDKEETAINRSSVGMNTRGHTGSNLSVWSGQMADENANSTVNGSFDFEHEP